LSRAPLGFLLVRVRVLPYRDRTRRTERPPLIESMAVPSGSGSGGNLHNRPKPGRRWRRSPNITPPSSSPSPYPAPCLCPRPRAPSLFPLSQAYGRDYPQSSLWTRLQVPTLPRLLQPPLQPRRLWSIPMPPECAALLDATSPSEYPPLLHPFPPDAAPSAAPGVSPLPKRHRGQQQTFPAPHPSLHSFEL